MTWSRTKDYPFPSANNVNLANAAKNHFLFSKLERSLSPSLADEEKTSIHLKSIATLHIEAEREISLIKAAKYSRRCLEYLDEFFAIGGFSLYLNNEKSECRTKNLAFLSKRPSRFHCTPNNCLKFSNCIFDLHQNPAVCPWRDLTHTNQSCISSMSLSLSNLLMMILILSSGYGAFSAGWYSTDSTLTTASWSSFPAATITMSHSSRFS